MTVPSTASWNPTITQLIAEMYRDLDIIADDEEPTAAQYNTALFKASSMVKSLQATGIHVWTEEEAILFLQPYQARYTLGSSTTADNAHCCDADRWTQTSLSASLSAAATVIPVTLSTGMLVSDKIGIALDSGVTFWTTVTVIAGNNVTVADALPSSASNGNLVVDYPPAAQIGRPLKVPRARYLTYANSSGMSNPGPGNLENPMTILSRQEYMDLPQKQAPGVPTQWFYTPQLGLGYFYIWPVPTNSAYGVRFTWYRSIADLLVPTNTLDFPQEWATPIRWLLANEMKTGYSLSPSKATQVTDNAAHWLEVVSGWDKESEPIQFGMAWETR